MIKTPHLIQRATILNPLMPATTRLSQAVDMDYMGSSEFEFGALARSFRAMENGGRILRLFPNISENSIPLRVFSILTNEEFSEYGSYLLRLRGDDIRTLQERSEFNANRSSHEKANFWWDIENHVMWGFHKEFMKRVPYYVNASLAYMNAKKN
jgi:hypothetical protein